MKVLTLLLTSLFSQDSFLVKQGGVEVPLSDLDAYVYLLQAEQRGGFAMQKEQIESNIFTLLNMNIVYQHIMESDLSELEQFQAVIEDVKADEWVPDESFIDTLEVDSASMEDSVRTYVIKRELYKTLLAYLDETTTEDSLKNRAMEYYMVNKSEFKLPEIRDISVIKLDGTNEQLAAQLLDELGNADQDAFQAKAVELSVDPSKSLNEGHWGEFKKTQFNYEFKNAVFSAQVGVIPQVLHDHGADYIIRVNGITPAKQGSFADAKELIFKKIKMNAVSRKFQTIINEKAVDEIQVNPELVAHVFERYKVFIED